MREFDFYIVPTPIGNLGDITLRAIEILKSADVIACEDSRNTQKLLNHFSIGTKCISYHKFNENERVEQFVNLLKDGKKIALVSDAGTPLFCDPGSVIVRELNKRGYRVTSLPGANAMVTFLSQISRDSEEFSFIGFLPKTKNKILEILERYRQADTLFYESPNRLIATLNIILENYPDAVVSVGRELTKVFEEVVTDSVSDIVKYFSQKEIKGEIVVMLHKDRSSCEVAEFNDRIKKLKVKGFSDKDIVAILSALYDVNKNKLYSYLLNSKTSEI